jgi:hypothetical protein
MPSPNILTFSPALDLSPFATPEGDERPDRIIDPGGYDLQAQVTIDEDHEDDLEITQHPVETGAAITDHAYKKPSEVRVRVGWSNAYLGGDVKTMYEQIQQIQNWRYPFKVYTGKRQYDNMLIASLRTHTDEKLEFSFIADITFREIILVDTSVTTGSSGSGGDAAAATSSSGGQGNPQANAPTTTKGTVATPPVSATSTNATSWGAEGTAVA